MTTDAQKSVRRVFGRGFVAGLAAAYSQDEAMNAARLKELESAVTAAAKKVLECVPIGEAWSITQICAEMARQGKAVDRRHIDGCLASLKKNGLVREPVPSAWIRVTAKPHLTPVDASILARADAVPAPAPIDPLERLANLAVRLRDLSAQAVDLAGEIESAALDVEARIERAGEDGKKLKQLQALLKGLE